MRMDDCDTDTTYSNQTKHLPSTKAEIVGEDEASKEGQSPLQPMQTTLDKSWSPILETSDHSIDRESILDTNDPVGSSVSPQVAECDSAQSSGAVNEESDAKLSLTTVDSGDKAAMPLTRESAMSLETSICAVSSTVNDDDEKECRTVTSSFSICKPVPAREKDSDVISEDGSRSSGSSSSLDSERVKSSEEKHHSQTSLKRSSSGHLGTTLLSYTGTGSSCENKRHATDEIDAKSATKKIKVSGTEPDNPESERASGEANTDNILQDSSQSGFVDSASKKCSGNEQFIKTQGNIKDDTDSALKLPMLEVANNSRTDPSGSIIKENKQFNSPPGGELKEKESVFVSNEKKDFCTVSVVSWSASASQPCANSNPVQDYPVTSTVSQNTTDTIHRTESPIRLKDVLELNTDSLSPDYDKEKVKSVSSNPKIVPSTSCQNILEHQDKLSSQNKIGNERKCSSEEPMSKDSNTDTNKGHLSSSVKDCSKISTPSDGNPKDADDDCQGLSISAPLLSSSNLISSSSLPLSPTSLPPVIATTTTTTATTLKSLSTSPVDSNCVTSSCKTNQSEMVLKYTDGQFECQLCAFSSAQSSFEDHLFKHMEDQALRCDDCSANIYSINAWHQHLLERHEGERVLPTNVCEIIDQVKISGIQTYKLKPFVHLAVDSTKSSSAVQILSPDANSHKEHPGPELSAPSAPGFLEFTFVNKEYFCLKCSKKSKDKEIFHFHIWTHTHSPESTYCCCTTLTRESCEVVANIIQLISNMNQSLITDLMGADSKEKVVICRVRKVDLNLETVFKRPSEVKNLYLSTSLLADRDIIPVKQSSPASLSDPKPITGQPPLLESVGISDKDFETPKIASVLKETVIVENPLRAGIDHSTIESAVAKGCEKFTNSLVNNKSADAKGLELRASLKKPEAKISLNSFEPEKKKLKRESELCRVKIKREPEEDLLLADINKKIMNIKKEVKEFASLTDMLCDMSSANKIVSPVKTELNEQDEVLDLKVCSSLSKNVNEEPKSATASMNSPSHLYFGSKGTNLSKTTLESFSSSLRSLVGSEISSRSVETENRGAFYKCGFNGCQFAGMNSMEFRSHLENAHKYMDAYPCAHCGHTAAGEESLLRHMQTHTMSKVFLLYKCAFYGCRFGTNLLHEFREHNEILHQYETNFRCLNCNAVFYELSNLIGHLKNNLLKFIQCPHCSVKDRNRQTVLSHISEAHPGKPKQIVVTSQVVCREKQEESLGKSSTVPEPHPTRPHVHAKNPFLQKDAIEYIETKLNPKDIPPALKLTLEHHEMANSSDANSKNKFSSLAKHQIEHLKEMADIYLHTCKLCKYSTNQSYLLEEHMQNYHPSFLGDFSIKRQVPDSSALPKNQRDMLYNFKLDTPKSSSSVFENKAVAKACCHLCPVAYKHVQQLKTHVRVKHPKCQRLDFYKCIHCNAKSTSKEYLITSCKKRHPNKEFHLTRVQEVLEHPKKKKSEMLDIIVNRNQESNDTQRCEHGYLPPCFQCEANSPDNDLGVIKHWKQHLLGSQSSDDSIADYEKPFVCKVFKYMVKPTKAQRHSPILTVPSAKNALPKISKKSKSKSSSDKKKSAGAASSIDGISDFLPPCEIGSQTLDSKLSVLYTRNRKWNRCKCCQFTTDHVATIHHHILDCHLKLYLWSCPYCDLKSIKKQNIIQHCLHFHEPKKPGANFEDQDWNKHIRGILNLLPKDTSASTFTKQTFIISGPSSEAPNCYRLATEPLSIPASLTKSNRPTVVKLSNGVYKCSVCSTKGFVEWQVQKHIDTEHWAELKESKEANNIVLNLENPQTEIASNITNSTTVKGSNSGKKSPQTSNSTGKGNTGSEKSAENHQDVSEQLALNNPTSKDEEMKAMANKIIEVAQGVLQCPFCFYRSRLRTCVKCHIWSQHMMLKRKRCKHCSFASWFDSGIEAHMATEHPRLCFNTQTAKNGYTVLVEEPDGTWKETTVNFVHTPKISSQSRKRPIKKSTSEENQKKSKSSNTKSSSKKELSESVENSPKVLNLSKTKSSEARSPQTGASNRPGVITSSKSLIKPGLLISPKFFKMSKSGVLNISKVPLQASATKQQTTPPSQNKLNLINVPKFKARDSSLRNFHVGEASEDEAGSKATKSKNAQEKQAKSKNIFSRLLGRTEGGTTSGQPPKRQNNNNNNNASHRKNTVEKALPDSLISIDTRMEEMCVREFDEKLMQNTFTCTICSYKTTNRTTFNSHTYSHKPPAFKCGYCPFRANPRCRVTAHIRKYHKEPMIKIINLSNLPKRAIDKNPPMTKEELDALPQHKNKPSPNKSKKSNAKPSPLSSGSKKLDVKMHGLSGSSIFGDVLSLDQKFRHNEEEPGSNLDMESHFTDAMDDLAADEDLYSSLTFCCHSCSFKTTNIDRFTKHTSLHNFFTHGMKVACMDCSFSTNRILDYEDHISRHMDGFLFYCGYCSFSSLEEQEVREHSLKKHPDRVISIEISPGPSSLSTKWSPIDLDPSVELTDFLAMDCERFYNLISMYGVTMVDLKSTAVSYEDMNSKSGSDDSSTELDIAESPEEEDEEETAKTVKDSAEEPDDDFVAIRRPLKKKVTCKNKGKKFKRKGKLLTSLGVKKRSDFDDPFSSDNSDPDQLLHLMDASDKEVSEDEDLRNKCKAVRANHDEDDDDDDDAEEEEDDDDDEEEETSKTNTKLKTYRRIKINDIGESDDENDGDIDDDEDRNDDDEGGDYNDIDDSSDSDEDFQKPSEENKEESSFKMADIDAKETSEIENEDNSDEDLLKLSQKNKQGNNKKMADNDVRKGFEIGNEENSDEDLLKLSQKDEQENLKMADIHAKENVESENEDSSDEDLLKLSQEDKEESSFKIDDIHVKETASETENEDSSDENVRKLSQENIKKCNFKMANIYTKENLESENENRSKDLLKLSQENKEERSKMADIHAKKSFESENEDSSDEDLLKLSQENKEERSKMADIHAKKSFESENEDSSDEDLLKLSQENKAERLKMADVPAKKSFESENEDSSDEDLLKLSQGNKPESLKMADVHAKKSFESENEDSSDEDLLKLSQENKAESFKMADIHAKKSFESENEDSSDEHLLKLSQENKAESLKMADIHAKKSFESENEDSSDEDLLKLSQENKSESFKMADVHAKKSFESENEDSSDDDLQKLSQENKAESLKMADIHAKKSFESENEDSSDEDLLKLSQENKPESLKMADVHAKKSFESENEDSSDEDLLKLSQENKPESLKMAEVHAKKSFESENEDSSDGDLLKLSQEDEEESSIKMDNIDAKENLESENEDQNSANLPKLFQENEEESSFKMADIYAKKSFDSENEDNSNNDLLNLSQENKQESNVKMADNYTREGFKTENEDKVNTGVDTSAEEEETLDKDNKTLGGIHSLADNVKDSNEVGNPKVEDDSTSEDVRSSKANNFLEMSKSKQTEAKFDSLLSDKEENLSDFGLTSNNTSPFLSFNPEVSDERK